MWSKFVRNLSEIEQFAAKLLVISRFFAHVMSSCDLDLCPLDLELLRYFDCHVFKLCTNFERNRIIHGEYWRFSIFSPCISAQRVSGVHGPNFTKLGKDIGRSFLHKKGRSFLHKKFVSEFGYLAVFSNAGGSKLSNVENDAKFCTFLTHCEN